LASLARARAIEADQRCREADLAAEMARVLLRTDDLRSALPGAAANLAQTLGLPAAAIELEPIDGDEHSAAFPLRDGRIPLGTLLTSKVRPATQARLREHVVPAVEAVLRAARDREAMESALKASRDELRVLAEEQAALRRVAMLVAGGAAPEEVFGAVVEEAGKLLSVDLTNMCRYESDGTETFVATWGSAGTRFPVGSRWPLGGRNLGTIVFETGRPVRIDSYAGASGALSITARDAGLRSAVATPITVDDRLWGMMGAGSTHKQPLPVDTEARLGSFTELVATSIGNAESRARLACLADEQAALRRVATLVARGASPAMVFAAVTEEVAHLLSIEAAIMGRYGSDDTVAFVGGWGKLDGFVAPLLGSRWSLGGKNVSTMVARTGRAARIDDYADSSNALDVAIRGTGVRSSVGTPLVVEGRLWGVVIASSTMQLPLQVDTEARLASFSELLATAIANAESRAALAASRARVVAASDQTRRRIERDLHDGIQQRLVSLGLELRLAQASASQRVTDDERIFSQIAEGLASLFNELREISRGIHPAILSKGGLEPALRALARRSTVPVELDLHIDRRLPECVEVAAYYVVSEALTNAAKHAQASVVSVDVTSRDSILQLAIRDDGVGGADPGRGSGLLGLSDRIETLGGTLQLISPAGEGTTLLIEIPPDGQIEAPRDDQISVDSRAA
jgi:signal transduction histidine kinase